MDLTIKEYVALVKKGRKELGEIPVGLRDTVKARVEQGDKIIEVIYEDDLEDRTVKQLLEIAKYYPSIKYESRMLKADIIKAIRDARAKEGE